MRSSLLTWLVRALRNRKHALCGAFIEKIAARFSRHIVGGAFIDKFDDIIVCSRQILDIGLDALRI